MKQYFPRGFGWTIRFLHPTPNHEEIEEVFHANVPEYWSVSKEPHALFFSSMSLFLKRMKLKVKRITRDRDWLFKSMYSHYSIGIQQKAELDEIMMMCSRKIGALYELYCGRKGEMKNSNYPLFQYDPKPYGCWSAIHLNFTAMQRLVQFFMGGVASFSLIETYIWKKRYTNRHVIASDLLYLTLNEIFFSPTFYRSLRDVALSPSLPRQFVYLGWYPFKQIPNLVSFYNGCNLRFDLIQPTFTPKRRRFGGYPYFMDRFQNRVRRYQTAMRHEKRLINDDTT